jgi:hypothetical protein
MNRKLSPLLQRALLFSGALLIGWAANAQSTTNPSDTTHPHGSMYHHHQGNRMGGDSTGKKDFAHRGPGGGHDGFRGNRDGFHGGRDGFRGRDGWAFHRRGEGFRHGGEGFRHGGQGFRHGGEHIRYTPEQRKQVMAINKDYRQKSEDLFKQDNLTLKQYKAGLVALQKDKKDKLQALLTPQQKDEMAARHKRMTENAQVMEVARLERLKLRLNLSDDQVTKIKTGQEALHSQFKAIHENDNLLPQQKMEQMKALMAKRNDTFKAVLTPDQYTQFEKMSHHRPGGPGGPGQGGRFGGSSWQGRGSENSGSEADGEGK